MKQLMMKLIKARFKMHTQYNKDHTKKSQERHIKILSALDKGIAKNNWQRSVFLKAIGEKLTDIRNVYFNSLSTPANADRSNNFGSGANKIIDRSQQVCVFVSLYNNTNHEMEGWQKQIRSLFDQSITRPIYTSESDAEAIIKTKQKQENEAYLAVYVDKNQVIQNPNMATLQDRLGHTLVQIKDKSIDPNNIVYMVHASGHYVWDNNKLTKKISL